MARFELTGDPDEVDAVIGAVFRVARLRSMSRGPGDRDGEVRVRGNIKPPTPVAGPCPVTVPVRQAPVEGV